MAEVKEIVRQIGSLAEELGRVVEGELKTGGAEAQAKIEGLSAELEKVHADKEEAQAFRREAERELDVAEKRIETLVQKLKDARQAAAEAGEEAQKALRRQLEALQGECDDARAELEQERSVRKRLEKGAAADEKRLSELEKAMAAGKVVAVADSSELAKLQTELTAAREVVSKERQVREQLESALAEAERKINELVLALENAQAASDLVGVGSDSSGLAQLEILGEKLKLLEAELAAEQQVCRRYARDCAEAQKRASELENRGGLAEPVLSVDRPTATAKAVPEKLLPHELRPLPKPGVLFRPDWDLQSLPCAAPEQILQAWASVSNVQLSLEGYPSQYCSAYLVVLKHGKQKQLYMLFNLKEIKHVLVCVPSTPPKDEATLAKLIGEGQKYLQMSGFDLEKLSPADIPKRMGHYLQG